MKTIPEILNITQRTYEERLIFDKYLLWCDLQSADDHDCQKLLANAAVFAWWLQEYRRLENEFRQEAAPYVETANPKTLLQLYIETVIKIRDYYPKPLIQTARKTNIVCDLN